MRWVCSWPLAAIFIGCGEVPARAPFSGPPALPPRAAASSVPAPRRAVWIASTIELPGDGTTFAHALAKDAAGVSVLVQEGREIARHVIDVERGTADRRAAQPITGDRLPAFAASDAAGALWWVATGEQHRHPQPSSDGDFPRADAVRTLSHLIGGPSIASAEIRVCPQQAATVGVVASCDHLIHAIAASGDRLILAGSLNPAVGARSSRAWIAAVASDGRLIAEHLGEPSSGETWVDRAVVTPSGVVALVWTKIGESALGSLVRYSDALALAGQTPLQTRSWVSRPWSAAVASPEGGAWIVAPISRDELVFIVVTPDGAIASERPIRGLSLPITSSQVLGVRGGRPWFVVGDPYARPRPLARLVALDPASAEILEEHAVELPDRFAPERILVTEQGVALAGRVDLARPAVVWLEPAR